jgi:prophage antirepressor-like protein
MARVGGFFTEEFEYDFKQLSVVDNYENTWFCGENVVAILGYTNTEEALNDIVDDNDRVSLGELAGNDSRTIFINENGLFSLVLELKTDATRTFLKWVVKHVYPYVRKKAYLLHRQMLVKDEVTRLKAEIADRDRVIAKMNVDMKKKRK